MTTDSTNADKEGYIWFNGAFKPWRETDVHLLTHSLHYGGAAFEGQRAYNGKIFKLREHTERLFNSAEILGMEVPYSIEDVMDACNECLDRNGLVDAYSRPIIWRGNEMGITGNRVPVNVAVASWVWPSYYTLEQRKKGLRLMVSEWKRPAPDTAPVHAKASGLYMICTMSRDKAENLGYDDAMMLDYRGQVAEATGANMFFIKEGELHTPIADCFLDGITRRTVMDLAERRQVKIHERVIMPDELGDFEEAFLTGTAAEVSPISEIGEHRYTVGALSEQLMVDYDAEVRK